MIHWSLNTCRGVEEWQSVSGYHTVDHLTPNWPTDTLQYYWLDYNSILKLKLSYYIPKLLCSHLQLHPLRKLWKNTQEGTIRTGYKVERKQRLFPGNGNNSRGATLFPSLLPFPPPSPLMWSHEGTSRMTHLWCACTTKVQWQWHVCTSLATLSAKSAGKQSV